MADCSLNSEYLWCCKEDGSIIRYKTEEVELIIDKIIDWEQRRFELVKSVFPIVIQKKSIDYDLTIEQFAANVAIVSINYADAVIAKLKEE